MGLRDAVAAWVKFGQEIKDNAKRLGVSVDMVRTEPKPVEQKPEKEPERPVFNRYRALIDK